MRKMTVAVLGLVLVLSGAAQAAVLVADDFNYNPPSLVGNAGGYSMDASNAWTSPWKASAELPPIAGQELNWEAAGADLQTNPTIGWGAPGPNGVVDRSIVESATQNTVYLGFDLKRYPGSPSGVLWGMTADQGGSPVGSQPDISILGLRDAASGNFAVGGTVVSGGGWTGYVYTPGVYHRVVGRLQFDAAGANEVLTVWVNPALETDAPALVHNTWDLGPAWQITELGVLGRDIFADPCWALDRMNLTTDFASARDGIMVPEPATLSVLVLSAVAGLLRRRR